VKRRKRNGRRQRAKEQFYVEGGEVIRNLTDLKGTTSEKGLRRRSVKKDKGALRGDRGAKIGLDAREKGQRRKVLSEIGGDRAKGSVAKRLGRKLAGGFYGEYEEKPNRGKRKEKENNKRGGKDGTSPKPSAVKVRGKRCREVHDRQTRRGRTRGGKKTREKRDVLRKEKHRNAGVYGATLEMLVN